MPEYSEQDLEYAAQFREEIHKEALAIVRKTRPDVNKVVDRHPVEDYFQENWEYPGKMYTVVAIPYGYKSRRALVDTIVRDTLSGKVSEKESTYTKKLRDMAKAQPEPADQLDAKPDSDPFYRLIAEYTDLAVDYFIVTDKRYCGYASHKAALKMAFGSLCGDLKGDPDKAACKNITTGDRFLSEPESEKLSYKKAFLCPPHGNSYTESDFKRVNAALFPNGTDTLEVYEWTTDWSEYFDEGHEWWGTLCLTVYDKTLDRFAVIMASATD
ncbi:MAG: hypothetical protein J5662_02750 [Clostridia bacterium]|nr:hypothetical protein [Clostridia bacterium]